MRVAIYVRRKRRDYSLALARRLNEMGHTAFRVTPYMDQGYWSGPSQRKSVHDADRILNWGCSHPPEWLIRRSNEPWINKPGVVYHMAHKVRMFRALTDWGVLCVPWTTVRSAAQTNLDAGDRVVVRHVLQGHSGRGIQVIEPGEYLPEAPLYTRLTRGTHKREFRVLFMHGVPILWMRKRRRNGFDGDPLVRTHANGWVYCVNDVWRDGENEEGIHNYVTTTLSILNSNGVHFGALDFIGDVQSGRVTVLEVNTAPGLASDSSMRAVSEAVISE